jgi:hypothetical protein
VWGGCFKDPCKVDSSFQGFSELYGSDTCRDVGPSGGHFLSPIPETPQPCSLSPWGERQPLGLSSRPGQKEWEEEEGKHAFWCWGPCNSFLMEIKNLKYIINIIKLKMDVKQDIDEIKMKKEAITKNEMEFFR